MNPQQNARTPTLALAPGAPAGALDGCPGDLVVTVEHSAGGWSSACEITLSIDCEAPRCWFSRLVVGGYGVSAALLDEAGYLHEEAANG